ncbi:MAG: bifunctional 4-hydroxy-2-oxoglutarate aldolase/2-dehydro-3-deoxy-phosphogluconate aldolase [Halieaceae bacterium]|nr:bifunctional 4-hydroxy-2-oxoglutarate aldolase/2-dehydro-3-deoxy-phosphogluconate aldolase [Halieaceae bacterium]
MVDSPSFETLIKSPVIPVIVLSEVQLAIPLTEVLIDSGLTVIEITLRTEVAIPAIRMISNAFPKAIIGAGTVTTNEQIFLARDAGASFAISPGISQKMYQAANSSSLPFLPGVATPSEILMAKEAGFSICKFFPSEELGGVERLEMFAQIFPDMKFCPTGGISEANLASYLSLASVPVVAGSWIAPEVLILAKDWVEIEARAQRALEIVGKTGKA